MELSNMNYWQKIKDMEMPSYGKDFIMFRLVLKSQDIEFTSQLFGYDQILWLLEDSGEFFDLDRIEYKGPFGTTGQFTKL